MEIKRYIRRYLAAKKRGDVETAAELKRKMELGARGIISRYTQRKALLAWIAGFVARLTESQAGRKAFRETVEAYASDKQLGSSHWCHRVKRDVYFTEFYDRISADEYFRYHFEELSRIGRRCYVGDTELVETFRRMDDPEEARLLYDKFLSYQTFKPYYKREAMLLSGEDDRTAFEAFVERHPVFFAKPLSQCSGHGVRRLRAGQDSNLEELFGRCVTEGPVILEEPIRQGEQMARFHPQSINTVRVVTARMEGDIRIVQTSVRLGTGESVVDNGCLSAAVDTESGIIITPGRAAHEKGLYLRHPDTGVQILGSQIPDWDLLLRQVREQASLLRRQRIVGWDMAYSEDGWSVVEANSHPGIQILAGNGTGMRDVFEQITRSVRSRTSDPYGK